MLRDIKVKHVTVFIVYKAQPEFDHCIYSDRNHVHV